MNSVIETTRLFVEACDNRKRVSGTPNDDHVVKLKEDLLNVCLQSLFEGTNASDPPGAILEVACYQVDVSKSTPRNRQIVVRANYDPNLKANNPACCAKEENCAASTRNHSRKRAIDRGAND